MQNPKGKARVIPANEGRKIMVIGNEVIVKLTSSETNGGYYVFEAITPPGVGVPPHVHQHEDEIVQIIEGEFEVLLDGRTYRAGREAVLNFPRFIPHGFTNVGKVPTRALFTVTPSANFEKFFDELSALPTNKPPDFVKVTEIFKRYDIEILVP